MAREKKSDRKDVLRVSLGDRIRQDIAMTVARQKDLAVGGDVSRRDIKFTNLPYIKSISLYSL
jgi:hypothetical protein